MQELNDAAEDAKYQLAWCVPVVLYLHSVKECADTTAVLIKQNPEGYRSASCPQKPGPPPWARETLARAIGIIDHAEGGLRYKVEHKPGGYLNKASVVYVMSLVDWFVDKTHTVCCQGCGKSGFRGRLKCLNKKFGEPWFFDAIETKRVRYLALIRNMVVHQRAKTDKDLNSKSFGELRSLAHVWPAMPLEEFDKAYAEPETKLILDIAKVIMPGIRYCFDFLDYALNRANDLLGC